MKKAESVKSVCASSAANAWRSIGRAGKYMSIESGAIAEPLRSVEGFDRKKRHRDIRSPRDAHTSRKMFASRQDYQMTEEELAEFERQEAEEAERKKRPRQLNREPL